MENFKKKFTEKDFKRHMEDKISKDFTGYTRATQQAIEDAFLKRYSSVLATNSSAEEKAAELFHDFLSRQEKQLVEWETEVNYLHMHDAQTGLKKAIEIYGEIISADLERVKLVPTVREKLTAVDKNRLNGLVGRLNMVRRKLSSFIYDHKFLGNSEDIIE